jgi:uncharacterized lipoprotein YmbA
MRRWFAVLALALLAACAERGGAVSGPTLSIGGGVSGMMATSR